MGIARLSSGASTYHIYADTLLTLAAAVSLTAAFLPRRGPAMAAAELLFKVTLSLAPSRVHRVRASVPGHCISRVLRDASREGSRAGARHGRREHPRHAVEPRAELRER